MKTVLFITYNFPPCGGPSVQRSLKFAKYLPGLDWQPIVITTNARAYPIQDFSLENDIPPGTPIYRPTSWDVNSWRPAFRKLKLGKLHAAINTLFALPDGAIFWARMARPSVKQAIAVHQPQIVYTTSGPYSAHLLGLWIKKSFGLPWVADFRDPWSQNRIIHYPPGYRTLNRRMERQVLESADHIVTVSRPIAQSLGDLMGEANTPVSVIPNGYDPDDVPSLAPTETSKFTITYTGKFTRLRRPDALVEAVTSLVDSGQIPADKIELIFAGSNLDAFIPSRPPFTKLGYLPHGELGALWQRSTMLLLVQDPSPENKGAYSAKLFEYLAANRPILAITSPSNVAADLIRQTQGGIVVSHDPAEIKTVLLDYYRAWRAGDVGHSPDWEIIHCFSRPELTAQLADIFNQLADG